jgi:hypothetical protein
VKDGNDISCGAALIVTREIAEFVADANPDIVLRLTNLPTTPLYNELGLAPGDTLRKKKVTDPYGHRMVLKSRHYERPAAAVAETLTYSTAGLVQRSDEAEENSCERIDGGEGEDSLERGHFSRKLDLPTE